MASDLAKGTGTVSAEKPKAFDLLLREMAALAEVDNSSGVSTNSVEAILLAQTEEEMWDADDLGQLGGRDIAELEHSVTDFDVKWGNREDIESPFVVNGRKMYLLVTGVRISASSVQKQIGVGDEFVYNTSAPLLVAKLFWLRKKGKLPGQELVIKSTDLGGGKAVIKYKPIPKRAQTSRTDTA